MWVVVRKHGPFLGVFLDSASVTAPCRLSEDVKQNPNFDVHPRRRGGGFEHGVPLSEPVHGNLHVATKIV